MGELIKAQKLVRLFPILLFFAGAAALSLIVDFLFSSAAAQVVFWLSVFIASMYVLVRSSDYFVEYSERIASSLGISHFIIGVTIVSIGTSLPELVTSIIATFRGATEFVAGDVVGSNIANILLVLGISSIIAKKIIVKWDLLRIDLPLLLGSALVLLICLWDGVFSLPEALVGMVVFLTYTAYMVSAHKVNVAEKTHRFSPAYIVFILLAIIGLYYGAKFTIDSVIVLSELFGFADTSTLALSFVAIGTSLPELMVCVSAVRRKHFDIAVGNVVGSNIFNSSLVMGVPAFVSNLVVSEKTIFMAIAFMAGATFLFMFSVMDREITSFEGSCFALFYVLFLAKLFGFF